jgi:EAL domain-containing protein (putative c-di-GMP-specific phosphodiesterase class I)
VAEKTGKILDIDRWVISACAAMLARSSGVAAIAPQRLGALSNEPTLPRFIIDALRIAGVVPSRLIVELTETSAVSDLHDAQRFIESMRESGVRVCLDDFGAGFFLCLSEASGRGHAQDRRTVHPRSPDRP